MHTYRRHRQGGAGCGITIELCRIINVLSPAKILPSTKEQLWCVLCKKAAGIRRHAYCSECSNHLGILDELPGEVQCGACETVKARGKLKYFITLSVTKQLQRLLAIPHVWQQLQYKNQRQKLNVHALEDLMDGEGYRLLENAPDGLRAPSDFSYQLDTDGFSTVLAKLLILKLILYFLNREGRLEKKKIAEKARRERLKE